MTPSPGSVSPADWEAAAISERYFGNASDAVPWSIEANGGIMI